MYTKEDIEKAKQYLDNEGYGTGSNFTFNAVANLMAEYAAKNCVKPAVIHWVAITEKMPESGFCILLYSKSGGVAEGAWIGAKGHFEQWRWNSIKDDVTHWAELPEPPCV